MQVRVWDTETGQEVLVLRGHTGSVWAVSFSDDGKLLASWSSDVTVRIWDIAAGQEAVTPLRGHVSSWGDISSGMRMLAERVKDGPASAQERVVVGDYCVTSVEDQVVILATAASAAQCDGKAPAPDRHMPSTASAAEDKSHRNSLESNASSGSNSNSSEPASDHGHPGNKSGFSHHCGRTALKNEVVAQFGAPAKVTSVCCMGVKICAGCEDGQVCSSSAAVCWGGVHTKSTSHVKWNLSPGCTRACASNCMNKSLLS
jgi:hypothetical protein